MRTPPIDEWLEAETARGFRSFYAAHLQTIRQVNVVNALHIPVELEEEMASRDIPWHRWHCVYHPADSVGLLVPQHHQAWLVASRVQYLPATLQSALNITPLPLVAYDETRFRRIQHCLAGALTALGECEALYHPIPQTVLHHLIEQWTTQYLPPARRPSGAWGPHFFGSPLTREGPHTEFLATRFSQLDTIIQILDAPPTTISRLIRRMGELALLHGIAPEWYHDGLNPDHIDHLVLPTVGVGVTHAQAPHWIHPISGEKITWNLSTLSSVSLPSHDMREPWGIVFQHLYTQAWHLMAEIVEEPISPPPWSLVVHHG